VSAVQTSRLARMARQARAPAPPPSREPETGERCELCNAPVADRHRHLLELASRRLVCACRPCALLFDRDGSGAGRYKLIPERRLRLDGFVLGDDVWDGLRIPVDMAFFFRSSAVGRVVAFYPGPMGPAESQLELDSWREVEAANPVLAGMEEDVEALLVNRVGGAPRSWLVPVDDCYGLVGLIRTQWRGLSGGREVWDGIESFFDELDGRARSAAGGR
jgi:hypothetical protein